MSHVFREPEMKNSEGPFLCGRLICDSSHAHLLVLERRGRDKKRERDKQGRRKADATRDWRNDSHGQIDSTILLSLVQTAHEFVREGINSTNKPLIKHLYSLLILFGISLAFLFQPSKSLLDVLW